MSRVHNSWSVEFEDLAFLLLCNGLLTQCMSVAILMSLITLLVVCAVVGLVMLNCPYIQLILFEVIVIGY